MDDDTHLSDLIYDLFSRCSLSKQVELLYDRLPVLLKRDFISLLPSDITYLVLRYLDIRHTLVCLRVSRTWYGVITGCDRLWKEYAVELGVSPSLLPELLEKHVSYKSLAIKLLGAIELLQAASTEQCVMQKFSTKTSKEDIASVSLAPPAWNGVFVFIIGEYKKMVSIQVMHNNVTSSDVNELMEVTSLPMAENFTILWSQSSSKYVLIHGSDGSWIKSLITREPCDVHTSIWHGEIFSRAFYEIGSCCECSIVVVVTRAAREDRLWDLTVYYLEEEKELRELKTSFSFLPTESYSVFFKAQRIAVTPIGNEPCASKHRLLIQYSATICVFSLCVKMGKDGSELAVIEHLYSLCPYNNPSYYCDPEAINSRVCQSIDGRFAAYSLGTVVYIWSIESCEMVRVTVKNTRSVEVLAVGTFFTILYQELEKPKHALNSRVIKIISTFSGKVLLTAGSEEFVYGPTNQSWMNDLFAFTSKETIPISTVQLQLCLLSSIQLPLEN